MSVLSTAHAVNLTGLAASTTYHYQVLSREAQGNLTASVDFTFTTGAPPVVTGVNDVGDGIECDDQLEHG